MANDNKLVNLADLKEAFDNIPTVSQSAAGLMSADDKAKLDEAAPYKVIGPQSIVSVSDAIEAKVGKALINIEPVQDLHEYDHPWAGGAGKNKLDVTQSTRTSNGITFTNNGDGTITLDGTATAYTFFNLNYAADTKSIPTGSYIFSGMISTITTRVYQDGTAILNYSGTTEQFFEISSAAVLTYARIDIATGTTFNKIVYRPMIRLATETDATFEPYSNICPISGWTGATIQHTRNNIVDFDKSVTHNNGILKGTEIKISKGTRVYLQRKGGVTSALYGRKKDGSVFEIAKIEETKSSATLAFDITAIGISTGARAEYGENDILTVSLTDFTELSSYSGTTISISWQSEAGTVYGGTLDVTTGELVVTKKMTIFTGAEQGLIYSWDAATMEASGYIDSNDDAVDGCICSHTGSVINGTRFFYSQSTQEYPVAASITSGPRIRFRNRTVGNTLDAYKTYLQQQYANGTPVTIVGKLATPQTYQLTPVEIEMLLGDNNVWADTGDITVGYLREDSLGTGEAIADAIKSSDASHGQMIKAAMTKTFNDAIEVTTPMFSTLPKTFSVTGITPDHELAQDGFAYLSNPSALGSDWTITTGNDEFQISGTCNDSTYVKLSFCVKQKITATA